MNFAFLLSALLHIFAGASISPNLVPGIQSPPPDTSGVLTGSRMRQVDTSGVITGAKTKPRAKAMDTSGVITG